MCNIYYPFLKIENEKVKRQYNHKQNLLVLALVCNKILIPAGQLLDASDDKFDVLLNCKKLFENDIIYTRIPREYDNLKEYYDVRKQKNSNIPAAIMDIRISKIEKDIFKNKKEFVKYNIIEQQGYFSQKFRSFFMNTVLNTKIQKE